MNKYNVYLRACQNSIKSLVKNENDKDLIKKNVFYGVNIVGMLPDSKTYDEAVNNFEFASAIKQIAGQLTPKEFMNVFPIDKDFKGHKYDMKDYFYTRDYVKTLDQDKPIGEEIIEFFWEYQNKDTGRFTIKTMGLMSDINHFEGKPYPFEEWADMHGIETYTMHTDNQGKQFLMDKQGRTQKVLKPRPKHLKLV
ncbi:hypothetical protein [Virgibacillus kimchii]